MAGTLAVLTCGPAACDSKQHAANKALREAVSQSGQTQVTPVNAPAVQQAVEKSGVENAQAAVKALDPLSKSEAKTKAPWGGATLTPRQAQAISQALQMVEVEDRKAAIAALDNAVKLPDASDEGRAQPLAHLARLEASAGDLIAAQAAEREVVAARYADSVTRLLAQIRQNDVQIAEYKALDPAQTLNTIEEMKKKAAGSDGQSVWYGEGEQALPAGSAVQESVSAAEAELAKLKQQKTELEQKATKLRQDAANLTESARQQTGDQAYNSLIEASKLNQQASGIDLEAMEVDRKAMDAEHRLRIVQVRKPIVDQAVKSFEIKKEQVGTRWKGVQDLIAAIDAGNKQIVGDASSEDPKVLQAAMETTLATPGSPVAGGATGVPSSFAPDKLKKIHAAQTVTGQSALLVQTANDAEELRKQAADMYQLALSHADQAVTAAKSAVDQLKDEKGRGGNSPLDGPAYDSRIAQLAPGSFAYLQADIRSRLARIASDQLMGTELRSSVRAQAVDTLKAASITAIPNGIQKLPQKKDLEADTAKAVEAYGAVNTALEPFITAEGVDGPLAATGDTPAGIATQAARGLRANVLYAFSRLYALLNDKNSAESQLQASVAAARSYQSAYDSQLPPGTAPEVLALLGVAPTALPQPATAPVAAPKPPAAAPGVPAAPTPGAPSVPTVPGAAAPGAAVPGSATPGAPAVPAPGAAGATPGAPAPAAPAPKPGECTPCGCGPTPAPAAPAAPAPAPASPAPATPAPAAPPPNNGCCVPAPPPAAPAGGEAKPPAATKPAAGECTPCS